jgi:transcriptional regulator with XRE-family HTH domain
MTKSKADIKIAKHLYLLRKKLKQTQTQMATVMGVLYQQYFKYEHGIDRISGGYLLTLAKHYSIDLNDFQKEPEECIDLTIHDLGRVNHLFKAIEKELETNGNII